MASSSTRIVDADVLFALATETAAARGNLARALTALEAEIAPATSSRWDVGAWHFMRGAIQREIDQLDDQNRALVQRSTQVRELSGARALPWLERMQQWAQSAIDATVARVALPRPDSILNHQAVGVIDAVRILGVISAIGGAIGTAMSSGAKVQPSGRPSMTQSDHTQDGQDWIQQRPPDDAIVSGALLITALPKDKQGAAVKEIFAEHGLGAVSAQFSSTDCVSFAGAVLLKAGVPTGAIPGRGGPRVYLDDYNNESAFIAAWHNAGWSAAAEPHSGAFIQVDKVGKDQHAAVFLGTMPDGRPVIAESNFWPDPTPAVRIIGMDGSSAPAYNLPPLGAAKVGTADIIRNYYAGVLTNRQTGMSTFETIRFFNRDD